MHLTSRPKVERSALAPHWLGVDLDVIIKALFPFVVPGTVTVAVGVTAVIAAVTVTVTQANTVTIPTNRTVVTRTTVPGPGTSSSRRPIPPSITTTTVLDQTSVRIWPVGARRADRYVSLKFAWVPR